MSRRTRADPGFAVRVTARAGDAGPSAIVLRGAGLRLEAKTIGQGPTPRLNSLQQNRLVGFAAGWILDGGIDFVEEGKVVEIALCFQKGGLVERIAGVQSDGRATVSGGCNAVR